MPEIPNPKKNLKRNSEHQHSGTGKKRSMGDGTAQQGHTQTTARKNYPHITANSPQTNSATSSSTISGERKQNKQKAAEDPYMEKQRHFHRQQQLSKQKMAKKAAQAAAAAANNAALGGVTTPVKRQATPAKSGRRAKLQQEHQKQMAMKQLQMDMQQQQQQQFHQQQQQPIPMQIDLTVPGAVVAGNSAAVGQAIMTQQQLDMQFVTYATQHQPPQQIFMEKDIEMSHSGITAVGTAGGSSAITALPVTSSNPHPPSLITPLASPQIAASKRDISKNLNKLQMQQNQQHQQQQQLSTNIPSPIPSATTIPSHDLQSSLGNILSASTAITTAGDKNKTSEKTLISTTPVQKYIVEERQPGVAINLPQVANPGTLVNLQQNPHGSSSASTHIIQVSNAGGQQPQIMSFPQISAAATKLRAVNTTLIAPGTKITSTPTKKLTTGSTATAVMGPSAASNINAGALHELANVASTQSQVLHIVDTAANNNNNNSTNVSHATPLHTPPAVIQIHSTGAGATTPTSPEISTVSSQSKVLTTKILPLVLSGSANQSSSNSNLLNNSTLMMASSPTSSSSGSITSTSTATVAGGGTTIIKNLSSNMVLNTSTANLTPVTVTSTSNPIISTLGAGGTVFRKPPNIIKTSVAATTPTKSTSPSSSAPHIISNVKLTPVSVSSTSVGSHLTSTSTFKNVLPSTSGMVRTSVKICQSPNGKVFIQPAGLVDGSKMKLNTGSMPHKIISSTSANNSTATTSTGQRIAIQKVQIIPAPIGSSATGGTLQTAGNHINTKTGKGNMIFMPSSTTNVRPVTLSKMGNNILLKSSANQALTPTSPTTTTLAATAAANVSAGENSNIAKSNIVVLGPSPTTPVKEPIKLENSQLINEDTPLDILNMPIVMEPGVGVASSSTAAETVTVLQSNIIDASNVNQTSALAAPIILDQTQLHQPSKTVVLNVDWEMKLDIEQQNQYNNKNLKQNKRTISTSSTSTGAASTSSTSSSVQQISPGNIIKQKRLNNDYISMELKSKETSNPSTTIVTTTSASTVVTSSSGTNPANNNMIVIDDSFDDVIVEEHEDDASSVTSLDKHQTKREQQHHHSDSDTPKILDMKIYQQHDGHDNRIAQTTIQQHSEDIDIDVNDEDEDVRDLEGKESSRQQFVAMQESIRTETGEEQCEDQQNPQQQHQQHAECEIDAGFDETIGKYFNVSLLQLN